MRPSRLISRYRTQWSHQSLTVLSCTCYIDIVPYLELDLSTWLQVPYSPCQGSELETSCLIPKSASSSVTSSGIALLASSSLGVRFLIHIRVFDGSSNYSTSHTLSLRADGLSEIPQNHFMTISPLRFLASHFATLSRLAQADMLSIRVRFSILAELEN